MFIRRLSGNSNVYQLNLEGFLIEQDKIAKRYMVKLEGETDMEILDKYLLQIIEEIWEVVNSEDPIEYFEELCDTAMYLGSLYSILANRQGLSISIKPITVILGREEIDTFQIIQDLMSIRRFFPERKWHKDEKKVTNDEHINTICMEIVCNSLIKTFKFLASQDFDFEGYLVKKQVMILGLQEVSTDRCIKPLSIYRHFKNKLYVVIDKSNPMDFVSNNAELYFTSQYTEDDNKLIPIYFDPDDNKYYHNTLDYDGELIVYKSLYDDNPTYTRPSEMFLAKVDKLKYPNIKQEYRFELLTK